MTEREIYKKFTKSSEEEFNKKIIKKLISEMIS